MVAIWPYESLEQRAEIRRAAEAEPNPVWPPRYKRSHCINGLRNFFCLHPLWNLWVKKTSDRYMKCVYTPILPKACRKFLEAWSAAIPERVKFSPLAGCWYSEYGGVNNFIHLWAYKSFEERGPDPSRNARARGLAPQRALSDLSHRKVKLLLPAPFSPMQ